MGFIKLWSGVRTIGLPYFRTVKSTYMRWKSGDSFQNFDPQNFGWFSEDGGAAKATIVEKGRMPRRARPLRRARSTIIFSHGIPHTLLVRWGFLSRSGVRGNFYTVYERPL
jgi:hypothetical protein